MLDSEQTQVLLSLLRFSLGKEDRDRTAAGERGLHTNETNRVLPGAEKLMKVEHFEWR